MKTLTAIKASDLVASTAEKIKSNAPQAWSEGAGAGDAHRQGDIYIAALPGVPTGAVKTTGTTRLDAPDNHEGHHLDSLDGVTVYTVKNPGPCDGPVLVLTEPRRVVHGRHGHLCDIPAGVFAVTYQQNLDAQERTVRARD